MFSLPYLWFDETYDLVLTVAYSTALFTAFAGVFVIAPYGRFGSSSFGVELNPRVGWWLMEIMATVSFLYFYPQGPHSTKPVPLFFAALYLIHYANRGWYFPWAMRVAPGTKSSFSITVAGSGLFVTGMHGYLNAMWYSTHCSYLDYNWLQTPTCLVGLVLYEFSFWSTIYCEHIMRNLRPASGVVAEGESRYKIPRGFLFEYVTSPQYFTEIMGFFGWAIMTWSPAGLFIVAISCANLVPRAVGTQKWYREKFKEEYPMERKILIPFVW
jgi:3-oxo-5-alpha-steroid 4-dehydrogenase 1